MPTIKDVFDEVKRISKKLDDFCIQTATHRIEIKKNYAEYKDNEEEVKLKFTNNDKIHTKIWFAIYGTGGFVVVVIGVLKFLKII